MLLFISRSQALLFTSRRKYPNPIPLPPSHLTTLANHHIQIRDILSPVPGLRILHLLHNIHALHDLSKDNVFPV
jgi:hypothetical protein